MDAIASRCMPYPNTHTTLLAAAEVTLVSSVEQDGRTAACPGELVTFTCTVTHGATLNWASAAFTSCDSNPTYLLRNDTSVGSTSVCGSFQANLTAITNRNGVGQALQADLTSTLSPTTSVSPGTVIRCSDLTSTQSSLLTKTYPRTASKLACISYPSCASNTYLLPCASRLAVTSSEPKYFHSSDWSW